MAPRARLQVEDLQMIAGVAEGKPEQKMERTALLLDLARRAGFKYDSLTKDDADRLMALYREHFRIYDQAVEAFYRQELDKAAGLYVTLIGLFPEGEGGAPALLYTNYAESLCGLGQYEKGLEACDRAIQLKPADCYALSTRGQALYHMCVNGRRDLCDEACAALHRALALKPPPDIAQTLMEKLQSIENNNAAHELLQQAKEAGKREDYVEEERLYASLLRQYPITRAEIYSNHSASLRTIGDYEKALQQADHAIKLDPNISQAHSNRRPRPKSVRRPQEERRWNARRPRRRNASARSVSVRPPQRRRSS